jgi:hypothetical protein
VGQGDQLLKAYPAFVNFFEDTKETISKCEAKSPKFHAFLKKCESQPECGRQTLQQLLINPVQRLPRYSLLLKELLNKTEDQNPDKEDLKAAIEKIAEVLTHINEDKRKTEDRVAMFEIVNDIEAAPPNLLSAQRHFCIKVDAKLIISETGVPVLYKGHTFCLFLFNDCIEVWTSLPDHSLISLLSFSFRFVKRDP